MLVFHLSDLHFSQTNVLYDKISPIRALERAITYINSVEMPNEMEAIVLLTGDLSDDGSLESYYSLKKSLARLRHRYLLTPGNHDNRDAMLEIFKDDLSLFTLVPEYIQYEDDKSNYLILVLDTNHSGFPYGEMCSKRLEWLEQALERTSKNVVVAMHHPPINVGNWFMDNIILKNSEDFLKILSRYSKKIKLICCGHTHSPLTATLEGTSIAVAPSLAFQLTETHSPEDELRGLVNTQSFMYHQIRPQGIVHSVVDVRENSESFPLVSDWTSFIDSWVERGLISDEAIKNSRKLPYPKAD